MQYSYYDLGYVKTETIVTVTLSSAANVHLMDAGNYSRYSSGNSFEAFGGYVRYSPASFTVPNSGHWFVTIDLGGYEGYVSHSCLVEEPCYKKDYEPINWQIQDDNPDYTVKVSSRYLEKNPQHGSPDIQRTDMLIFDKKTGKHIHVTLDDHGNYKSWHKLRK